MSPQAAQWVTAMGGGGSEGMSEICSKGWLAIATLKPLVEREFLSTNEKPGFQRVANQTKLLPSPFFYDVSETNDE